MNQAAPSSQEILSEITIFSKYARYVPEFKRRETWDELVLRNIGMHKEKFKGNEEALNLLEKSYKFVYEKKALPSMRSLQFGGFPIFRNESRIYNCAYMPIEHEDAFSELMFLLLGGTGVGYSVQWQHVDKLPIVCGPDGSRKYLIMDSIEGWGDAVKVLVESYFHEKEKPVFDYSDIREEGSPLKITGGKAPGPKPLQDVLTRVEKVLHRARGRRLKPIECHDICCLIADAVLVAGIRRAALISLFSPDDKEMLTCKSGEWWVDHSYRGRANNSAVLLRGEDEHLFPDIWEAVKNSGSGEPGIYWTNDRDWGSNPCCEIALRPYTFCNLVEINAEGITSKEDYLERCEAAATIATFQASYTDFHYLRSVWKHSTRTDALIGVGITGIAGNRISPSWLPVGAELVKSTNAKVAKVLGINPAARTTTVKPSGTSSLVLGCSSGIHSWHSPYFLRRLRFSKDEPIVKYMKKELPSLVEKCKLSGGSTMILSIPQKAPDGAVTREESTFDLLNRVLMYNKDWVRKGHNSGINCNNVSATLSVKDGEWEELGRILFEERHSYNGMSVLPYDGGTYIQAPLEEIDEVSYDELAKHLHYIDLSKIKEGEDNTHLAGEAACAGGACEIPI
jgi:ribonucleoside-triphosphate reductase (thioredoxin)